MTDSLLQQKMFEVEPNTDISDIKVPPHSVEAEQSVLGGLMLSNNTWEMVNEILVEADFYRRDHRLIYRVMGKLSDADEPLDVITLAEELDKIQALESVGGLAYLGELAQNTPSIANIRAYTTIVKERSTLRQLISAAQEIADSSFYPEGQDSTTLLQEAERKLIQIAEGRPKEGGFVDVNNLLKDAVDRIDELFNSNESITGLSTGFTDLDEKTSGLQPSDLIILAARPSMGKTALAMNLVENAVMNGDKPVLVFSMEMPGDSIVMRMLSSLGRIDQTKIRNGRLDEEDWPKLSSSVSRLKDRPLFIDDTPALSPAEMRARTRRIQREHGDIGLIMVDYLQLMQIQGFSEGRTQEISEISRSLKAIAKEFNVPVVALSQLNRGLEQRPNKRPINSDLRESGAIEQDADVIAFIYRDEVYNEDSPDKGTAEIIIGKQRNGPIGTCRLAFIGKYTRFENLARDAYQEH